jgi:hypothetical protein
MLKHIALFLSALFFSVSAVAQNEQTDIKKESSCFFWDSVCIAKEKKRQQQIEQRQKEMEGFERYRQKKAQQAEEARFKAEQAAQFQREMEERKQAEAEEERKKQEEKLERIRSENAKRKAEDEAEMAAAEKRDRAAQKTRDAAIADRKARCGSDYKTPRIGMTIERVQECVGAVTLSSQVNRSDGIVSIYTYGTLWLNVMDGRVIAWGK